MAKGITQQQVNSAVDALVAAGERPTIERVRARLGTGSPDTVTRMLDVWWQALGTRLAQQATKVAMPEAPAEVSAAATQLWTIAIDKARERVERDVAAQRSELTQARDVLAAEGVEQQALIARQLAAAETAHQARELAETRLKDLQRLVDQQTTVLADLQHRHDQAVAGQVALTEKLDKTQATLAGAQEKATTERLALESAHRGAEDRWLREVDRARQDEATLTARLQRVERVREADAQKAATLIMELTSQVRLQERDNAAKSARLAALEGQLDRVHAQLKDRLAGAAHKPAAAAKKNARPRRASP